MNKTYIPADTKEGNSDQRGYQPLPSKPGVIEFHGTLAGLEQALGLRLEREGQAFRVVPLERQTQSPDSSLPLQNKTTHPKP